MPSLYACLGHPLAAAVNALMTRCDEHGWQPAVLACPCVIMAPDHWPHPCGGGLAPISPDVDMRAPPAAATMDGVFCARHIAGFEEDDPEAEDTLFDACFQCLVEAGLLPRARAA